MNRSAYPLVSASLFALFAIGHVVRAVRGLPFEVGAMAIPTWVSWAVALVAAALSAWGFRSRS